MHPTIKKACFFTLLPLSVFLSSCSSEKTNKQTQSFNLYLQADPFSLDPRIGGDRRSQILIRELFEGLYRLDASGRVVPALAKRTEISDDGLTYRFTLHESRWSNGSPVTAEDFEFAWKSLLDPHFATPYTYAFFLIKNAKEARFGNCSLDEVGIRAISPSVLEVELEHPAPYFLELTSNPLFSPICASVAKANPQWAKESVTTYVSNGPFILKERALKSHIIVEKNPAYWRHDEATPERLHFCIIEDLQTAYNMFERRDLDWLGDPCGNIAVETLAPLEKSNLLQKRQVGGLYWYTVNVATPHLRSAKMRLALAHAINRQALCQYLLQGGEVPAYSFLPAHLTQLSTPTFSDNRPDIARQLFDEALVEMGYTRETFPKIVISHWSDARDKMTAQTIQQQIKEALQIDVELECSDWSSYLKKVSSGDYQLAGFAWYSWYSDPMYNLEHVKLKNSGLNGTQWEDQEYISLLNQADKTLDPALRGALLAKAEQRALQELPLIPIYYQTYKYAKQPGIKGESLSPLGLLEFKYLHRE